MVGSGSGRAHHAECGLVPWAQAQVFPLPLLKGERRDEEKTPKCPQSPSSLQRGTLSCCPCRALGCGGCQGTLVPSPTRASDGSCCPPAVADSEHGGSSGRARRVTNPLPPHHRKSPDTGRLFARGACLRVPAPGVNQSRHTVTGLSASWCSWHSRPILWTPGLPRTKVSVGAALVVWRVKVQCGGGVQAETRAGGGGQRSPEAR